MEGQTLPLIQLSKPQFYYWKMVGSRELSLSKAPGRAVPCHIHSRSPLQVTSQVIKAQGLLSAPSHLVRQDRQPWHQPQPNLPLADLAEMPRPMGMAETWHPSAPSKIKDWRRVLLLTHGGCLSHSPSVERSLLLEWAPVQALTKHWSFYPPGSAVNWGKAALSSAILGWVEA